MHSTLKHAFIFFTLALLGACHCDTAKQPVRMPDAGNRLLSDPPLLLNEIVPRAARDQEPWIELINLSGRPVPLQGLELISAPGLTFEVDCSVSDLAPMQELLIVLEADDVPLQPLHEETSAACRVDARLASRWTGHGGWLALRHAKTAHSEARFLDCVAWGQPPTPLPRLLEKDRDHRPWYRTVAVQENAGIIDRAAELEPGWSFARLPGMKTASPGAWAVYSPDEASLSRGEPNTLPAPRFFTPASGSEIRLEDLALSWRRVHSEETYRVRWRRQSSDPADLPEKEVSVPYFAPEDLEGLDGSVVFSVQRLVTEAKIFSQWSKEIKLVPLRTLCGDPRFPTTRWHVVSSVEWRLQRKDTPMLCVVCDSDRNRPHKASMYTTDPPYVVEVDQPNPCGGQSAEASGHGSGYCGRACISMIASHYGAQLSQDRIAFHTNGCACGAEGDLSHAQGMFYNSLTSQDFLSPPGGDLSETLWWALGHPPVQSLADNAVAMPDTLGFRPTPPDFPTIRSWLDDDRPVMSLRTKPSLHAQVVNGYCTDRNNKKWLHVLDPERPPFWQSFDSWSQRHSGTWLGPIRAPNVRNDEATICRDRDGDELCDFDEFFRFATSPYVADARVSEDAYAEPPSILCP